MESEKVKEIKKALGEEIAENNGLHVISIDFNLIKDSLTLINDLEGENERLMKLQARGGCRVAELGIENQQLKDRIAELEKENKENNSYAKGYADGIKNTYEAMLPQKLKQFAERLKEKMPIHYPSTIETIDETLKEFINENATE